MSSFKKLLFYILISYTIFICSCQAYAQSASVRGFLYFKESGEPVIFTNVYLEGTTYGANSDVNGYYSITKVPPGTYTLKVTYWGYDTLKETISIKEGEILTRKLYLNKSVIQLKTVTISANLQEKQSEIRVSSNIITPKEIKQLPTIGGEPDLAQYLQVLPGVIFTGDQGGQLYIRGGSPVQNKVLLDGMIIYNPFHSIGLFSVFDADIIRNANVYTGGFNAEYGGRISSIMDITTRDGNKKRVGGKVAVSPFGAKTLLEGPLKKKAGDDQSSSSFIFSAKTSYLPTTSKVLYSYVDTNGLPFGFNDYYGKFSFNGDNGSKLNLFGFNFNDKVSYQSVSDFGWKSTGFGSNFVLVPSGSLMLVEGNFAYSAYGIEMNVENEKPKKSDIDGFNMGLGFTYFMGKNEIKYGMEVLGFKTNFELYNSLDRKIAQEENTTELAGFVKYKIVTKNKKWLIEPGFRAHYYASLGDFSPEPRIGMKFNVNDKLRLKFASGIYSQNLIDATSKKDIVNLFYGFLSGPDNIQATFTEKDGTVKKITHHLQKANHIVAGMEYDFGQRLEMNLEVYQKNFTQLTNLNRNKLYDDTGDNASLPDSLKKDFVIETGNAHGVDLLIKYNRKPFYLWAVYSLGFVTRYDGNSEYVPHFDRRHNANLVASYIFGKNHDWEADARWNLGSGFPFTPIEGFYELQTFSGGINTDYATANGELGILYGDYNSKRLPYYHRLDLTLKRKFVFSENSTLEVTASVTNVYNRKNIFYYNTIQQKEVYQLPILPSLSASWTF